MGEEGEGRVALVVVEGEGSEGREFFEEFRRDARHVGEVGGAVFVGKEVEELVGGSEGKHLKPDQLEEDGSKKRDEEEEGRREG
jgi:hypothetical protein